MANSPRLHNHVDCWRVRTGCVLNELQDQKGGPDIEARAGIGERFSSGGAGNVAGLEIGR